MGVRMKTIVAFLFTVSLFMNSFSQSVGIGTTQFVPKNMLDVSGSVAIGSGWAGTYAAPSNSLIVQNFIGVGQYSYNPTCPLTITYYAPTTANSPAINCAYSPAPTAGGTNDAMYLFTYAGNYNLNDPSGGYNCLHNTLSINQNGHSIGSMAGVVNTFNPFPFNSTMSALYGTLNNLVNTEAISAMIANIYGSYNNIGSFVFVGAQTYNIYGAYTTLSGNALNAYGQYVTSTEPTSGFYVGATLGNAYGLYVTDLSSNATTAYGVYCAGNQMNYFGGNVGIGNTNPGYKLQVGSSGDGTSAIANAWNTFSDIRLKTGISKISNASEMIDHLNGYYYYWKNSTDKNRQVGVIAQEVEKVLPELVTIGMDSIKSVDYPKLTAVLIEGFKEQQILIKNQQMDLDKMRVEFNSRLKILEELLNTEAKK